MIYAQENTSLKARDVSCSLEKNTEKGVPLFVSICFEIDLSRFARLPEEPLQHPVKTHFETFTYSITLNL